MLACGHRRCTLCEELLVWDKNAMPQVPGNSDKSFVSTLLLCVFVGFLGVNRFYVGKTRIGILMLLTFWGLGIGQLIDPIIIATQSFKDSEGLLIKA